MRGWAGDHPLLSACESSTRHRRHRAWRLDQHGKSSTVDDAADATQPMRRSRCDAADAQPTMDASDDATAADHVEGQVWPTLPIRVGVTSMFGLFRVCVSFPWRRPSLRPFPTDMWWVRNVLSCMSCTRVSQIRSAGRRRRPPRAPPHGQRPLASSAHRTAAHAPATQPRPRPALPRPRFEIQIFIDQR